MVTEMILSVKIGHGKENKVFFADERVVYNNTEYFRANASYIKGKFMNAVRKEFEETNMGKISISIDLKSDDTDNKRILHNIFDVEGGSGTFKVYKDGKIVDELIFEDNVVVFGTMEEFAKANVKKVFEQYVMNAFGSAVIESENLFGPVK